MRKSTKSTLILIGIAAIAISMIFFGLFPRQYANMPHSGGAAATVNGKAIHMKDFQGHLRMNMRSYEGQEMQPAMIDRMRKQTLEYLIGTELQVQLADAAGIRVSTAEIKKEILDDPNFQDPKTKAFSGEAYRFALQRNFYISPVLPYEYEDLLRGRKLVEQLREAMTFATQASNAQARDEYELENTKYTLRYAELSPSQFPVNQTISDEQIKAFLDDKANEAAIQQAYFKNVGKYRQEKEVHAYHILFSILPGASEESKKAQKERATKALAEIKGGLAWNAAVAKYSEDTKTKSTQGDLGMVGPFTTIKRFAQPLTEVSRAVVPMKKDQISDVVESPFGFHILKAGDVKEGTVRNLEDAEVKKELAQLLIQEKGNETAFEKTRATLSEEIKDLKNFDATIKKYGKNVAIKSTQEISLDAKFIPGFRGEFDGLVNFLAQSKQGDKCPEMYKSDSGWIACAVEKVRVPEASEFEKTRAEKVKGASQMQFYYAFSGLMKNALAKSSVSKNTDIIGKGAPEEDM